MEKVFGKFGSLLCFPRKMFFYSLSKFYIFEPLTNIQLLRKFDLRFWQTSDKFIGNSNVERKSSQSFKTSLVFLEKWCCLRRSQLCWCPKRQWFVLTAWNLETHMRIKLNIQRVCAYSFRFRLIMLTWKCHTGLKFHFSQNDRYEIHTALHYISPQFMWTQVESWLNTKVRFSTEMKSHTGLSLFRLLCEHTLWLGRINFCFLQTSKQIIENCKIRRKYSGSFKVCLVSISLQAFDRI